MCPFHFGFEKKLKKIDWLIMSDGWTMFLLQKVAVADCEAYGYGDSAVIIPTSN